MKMRRELRSGVLIAVLSVLAVFVLAACGSQANSEGVYGGGGSSPAPSPAGGTGGSSGKQVTISNFAFSPEKLTVEAGTTVTWTNQDGAPHNVTSTDGPGVDAATTSTFDSGSLSQGDTFSFTFDKPGTYYYECTIHASMASMHAQVIVK